MTCEEYVCVYVCLCVCMWGLGGSVGSALAWQAREKLGPEFESRRERKVFVIH